jgi:CBS domain-containing protein
VRRLVVVDDHGVLVGVLTQTDLGRVLDHRQDATGIDRGGSESTGVGLTLH